MLQFSLQVDQAKLLNKADGTMEKDVFSSLMFKKDDYISFKASEIDIRAGKPFHRVTETQSEQLGSEVYPHSKRCCPTALDF